MSIRFKLFMKLQICSYPILLKQKSYLLIISMVSLVYGYIVSNDPAAPGDNNSP
jgi:hypothetical protein